MPATLATESDLKAMLKKHALADNGLGKALAAAEKAGTDKPADKAKALDAAKKLAGTLAKDKAVAAKAEAVKFLEGLASGAETAKKNLETEAKAADTDAKKLAALLKSAGALAKECEAESKQDRPAGPCQRLRDAQLAAFTAWTQSVIPAEYEGDRARRAQAHRRTEALLSAYIAARNRYNECMRAQGQPVGAATANRLKQHADAWKAAARDLG